MLIRPRSSSAVIPFNICITYNIHSNIKSIEKSSYSFYCCFLFRILFKTFWIKFLKCFIILFVLEYICNNFFFRSDSFWILGQMWKPFLIVFQGHYNYMWLDINGFFQTGDNVHRHLVGFFVGKIDKDYIMVSWQMDKSFM